MSGPDRHNSAAGGKPSAALAFDEDHDPFTRTDDPVWSVTLWPHRSLQPGGFRWLMGMSAAAMSLPLIALAAAPAGGPIALAMAPYVLAALFALWLFIRLSYRSGRLTERLCLWPDAIAVERREPRGTVRRWAANPYWVDIGMESTRDIQHYLTLRGAGRRIELGAFLTPEERVELADQLRTRIARLSHPV
ncbi:MAG: DUF2244 domain-containing protein [Pseudomonadota bacterium]